MQGKFDFFERQYFEENTKQKTTLLQYCIHNNYDLAVTLLLQYAVPSLLSDEVYKYEEDDANKKEGDLSKTTEDTRCTNFAHELIEKDKPSIMEQFINKFAGNPKLTEYLKMERNFIKHGICFGGLKCLEYAIALGRENIVKILIKKCNEVINYAENGMPKYLEYALCSDSHVVFCLMFKESLKCRVLNWINWKNVYNLMKKAISYDSFKTVCDLYHILEAMNKAHLHEKVGKHTLTDLHAVTQSTTHIDKHTNACTSTYTKLMNCASSFNATKTERCLRDLFGASLNQNKTGQKPFTKQRLHNILSEMCKRGDTLEFHDINKMISKRENYQHAWKVEFSPDSNNDNQLLQDAAEETQLKTNANYAHNNSEMTITETKLLEHNDLQEVVVKARHVKHVLEHICNVKQIKHRVEQMKRTVSGLCLKSYDPVKCLEQDYENMEQDRADSWKELLLANLISGMLKEIGEIPFKTWEDIMTTLKLANTEVFANIKLVSNQKIIFNDYVPTPLHFAAQLDCVNFAKFFRYNGVSAYILNENCDTALHVAAAKGSVKAVEYFVTVINPNYTNVNSWQTPLMVACQHNNIEVIKQLLSKTKLWKRDKNGNTALHIYATTIVEHKKVNVEMLKNMCDCFFSRKLLDEKNNDDKTAFDILIDGAIHEGIQYFSKATINPDSVLQRAMFNYWTTPEVLQKIVTIQAFKEKISILLTSTVYKQLIKNDRGTVLQERPYLHIFAENFDETIMKLYIKSKGDILKTDCKGDTVFHLLAALSTCKKKTEKCIRITIFIINTFLKKAAKTHQFYNQEETLERLSNLTVIVCTRIIPNAHHLSVINYATSLGADEYLKFLLIAFKAPFKSLANKKLNTDEWIRNATISRQESTYYDVTNLCTEAMCQNIKWEHVARYVSSYFNKAAIWSMEMNSTVPSTVPVQLKFASLFDLIVDLPCNEERLANIFDNPPLDSMACRYCKGFMTSYQVFFLFHVAYMTTFTTLSTILTNSNIKMSTDHILQCDFCKFPLLVFILYPLLLMVFQFFKLGVQFYHNYTVRTDCTLNHDVRPIPLNFVRPLDQPNLSKSTATDKATKEANNQLRLLQFKQSEIELNDKPCEAAISIPCQRKLWELFMTVFIFLFLASMVVWGYCVVTCSPLQMYFLAGSFMCGWPLSLRFISAFKPLRVFINILTTVIFENFFRLFAIFIFFYAAMVSSINIVLSFPPAMLNSSDVTYSPSYQAAELALNLNGFLNDQENPTTDGLFRMSFIQLIYLLFAMFTAIILLNVFIAMINESYKKAMKRENLTWKVHSLREPILLKRAFPLFGKVMWKHSALPSSLKKITIQYGNQKSLILYHFEVCCCKQEEESDAKNIESRLKLLETGNSKIDGEIANLRSMMQEMKEDIADGRANTSAINSRSLNILTMLNFAILRKSKFKLQVK